MRPSSRNKRGALAALGAALAVLASVGISALASPAQATQATAAVAPLGYVKVFDSVPDADYPQANVNWRSSTVSVNYTGGPVMLSSTPDGFGPIRVIDSLDFTVDPGGPDINIFGTAAFNPNGLFGNCADVVAVPALDISVSIPQGAHTLEGDAYNTCGPRIGMTDIYLVFFPPGSTPTPPPPPPAEAALHVIPGDSHASGEGAFDYFQDSDDPSTFDSCHRSHNAFGPLLNAERNLGKMKFVACSGAVTDDFYVTNPSNPNEPAQLGQINKEAKLVTLMIGGNDAGFDHAITKCVDGTRPPGAGEEIKGQYGCSRSRSLRQDIINRLDALAGHPNGSLIVGRPIHPLVQLYRDIHTRAPGAQIIVGGYSRLFGTSASTYPRQKKAPSGQACEVGEVKAGPFGLFTQHYHLDYLDALWLDVMGNRLNATISDAVDEARRAGVPIKFAPAPAFNGHGLCDRQASWVNGLGFVKDPGISVASWSFHPSDTGQRLGYKPAFEAALN